ncbi:murein DD-endopeptidase MepM/ murein hydrolase activator NlpD [Pacificibacter maritimus]|uniref:Murein DD-endopeptidase MepM/ murein hydrolase activator NlpD n=1 Tax=Pacificibacter maritimus TaxID=762213 RepID=A0A3N4UUG1_9RHOB|nr:M23 family metallopeptidase [Pacificibacter maritimus]RPE71119.1 murein DD-endopeptidase MepM/ murein hydrolase activator NlpD [Pacificibacter maritimus]
MTFIQLPAQSKNSLRRLAFTGCAALALTACDKPLDFDLRGLTDAFSTAPAALEAQTVAKPKPDANGIISYPNYQVAIARKNDTIDTLANRIGMSSQELAQYNGIPMGVTLRAGEVIALPRRVDQVSTVATPTGTIATGERIDVTSLANEALTSKPLDAPAPSAAATPTLQQNMSNISTEPVRHQVQRGETAYSIARKYGISVRALSDWNGLGSDLAVQEGRYVLIPVKAATTTAPVAAEPTPGTGSAAPTPPSAAEPLPDVKEATPAPAAPVKPAANLGSTQTSSAEMTKPVSGPIIRDYDKDKSKFVLFSAPSGTNVQAAKAGTVKLVSTNADGVQIVVIDHGDGLQTAYSFIDNLSVKKGDKVSKGQSIAKVTSNEFNALQFMVFKGTQTVDPSPYLN